MKNWFPEVTGVERTWAAKRGMGGGLRSQGMVQRGCGGGYGREQVRTLAVRDFEQPDGYERAPTISRAPERPGPGGGEGGIRTLERP